MPKVQIAIGEEFFEDLRKKACYYADKTGLISKLIKDKNTKVTLFTRPRRFGKTLTMTMMQSFFDINRNSRELFEGLEISGNESLCAQWLNQYPVLFVSLKDVAALNYEEAYKMLRGRISDLCKAHPYLLDSNKVDEDDKGIFKKLKAKTAEKDEIESSLFILTRMMCRHYGKPVILLIDEYDVPLAKAHDADKGSVDYYPRMLATIRGLMSTALKTNEFLQLAVITGCLRIAKESIFTGVNNFKTYGILDREFGSAFGFTEAEVEGLLERAGFQDRLEVVRRWYDGYVFGDSEMFCPWDVLNYVDDLSGYQEKEPDNYWKDTSSNEIVDEFVGNDEFEVAGKFETLMNGGTIRQTITDRLTYEDLQSGEDNFWSVLFMTGYLTKADRTQQGSTVDLRIPNAEIASIFKDSIVSHFKRDIGPRIQDELMSALWNEDEQKVSELLTDALFDTISYFDYHEDYYHAFMTGLVVGGKGCEVSSNQENGLGRTDIVIKDRRNRRAIIIETKKSRSEDSMEEDAAAGMRQIMDKKYGRGLKGFKKIICYGIAFFEKMALARLIHL